MSPIPLNEIDRAAERIRLRGLLVQAGDSLQVGNLMSALRMLVNTVGDLARLQGLACYSTSRYEIQATTAVSLTPSCSTTLPPSAVGAGEEAG